MLSLDDIGELLGLPVIGCIPESENVLESTNEGRPVIANEESHAGQAYKDVVDRFLGEERPWRHLEVKPKGFWNKLFS